MGVCRCLARFLTSLEPLRTPKRANGPRSNSFRPDFPSATNLPTGTENELSGQKQGLVSVRSPAAFWQVVNRNRLVSAL